MAKYIKRIKATGIHGRWDIDLTFRPGVNIIYGKNGSGKTTLLHILANVLNEDFERFRYLIFSEIHVEFDNGQIMSIVAKYNDGKDTWYIEININNELIYKIIQGTVVINEPVYQIIQGTTVMLEKPERDLMVRQNLEKVQRGNRLKNNVLNTSMVYFPAFRTMIEAWANMLEMNEPNPSLRVIENGYSSVSMKPARKIFGNFLPKFDYPSLLEIEKSLDKQIYQANNNVAQVDRNHLLQTTPNILKAIAAMGSYQPPNLESILEDIDKLFIELKNYPLKTPSTVANLRTLVDEVRSKSNDPILAIIILDIYHKALQTIVEVQRESFAAIKRFLDSVNSFLENKYLIIDISDDKNSTSGLKTMVKFQGDDTSYSFQSILSSGEQQIITMLYVATQMNDREFVLIDEPEISLHVDWQRSLIKEIEKQLGQKQLIVCTHSPVIGADYEDEIIILEPTLTKSTLETQAA